MRGLPAGAIIMSKEKTLKNTPVGAVRYWWGRALFARYFEIEVNLAPARIAAHLGKVRCVRDKSLLPTQRIITIREIEPERAYAFEMQLQRQSTRGDTYTSVKASGRIVYSEGYATSIIRGDIRVGGANFFANLLLVFFLMLGVIYSLLTGPSTLIVLLVGFGLLVMLYTFWQTFVDYHELNAALLDQIEHAYYEHLVQEKRLSDAGSPPVISHLADEQQSTQHRGEH